MSRLHDGVLLKREEFPAKDLLHLFSEEKLTNLQKPTDIDDVLFDLLKDSEENVPITKFWAALDCTGLRETDPRLKETRQHFQTMRNQLAYDTSKSGDSVLDRQRFKDFIHENIVLIGKAFKNQFIIPDFIQFTEQIHDIYEICKNDRRGKPADYIPQLARANPDNWGVALCTVDGQRYSAGDTTIPFCIQSCSKPLNYALALTDMGAEKVHSYVGQEPSGRSFNEICLDSSNKPHNPMINAGAIITSSLLKPTLRIADRFDYVHSQYKRIAGGEFVGFSNATYLSEKETADRNFSLAYYMRENKCFPENADLVKTLEFYFQLCSVEITAETGAVIAATLANGGICPTTGEKVLTGDAVRNTLSLMYSCGMYDYSGQFAFKCGLPAKSGVAGAILIVVPNVMGVCTWAPSLDELGNSCRGITFCKELVNKFSFHNYDDLMHTTKKMDPRSRKADVSAESVVNILFAAATGDITALRRFVLCGCDMAMSDYDGRTAMHLGAAEGHMTVLKFLIEKCKVPVNPKDRWGFTPLDDAKRFKHSEVVNYLQSHKGVESSCLSD
ncbi:unnamed protein product [Owenia fusiformis]|uniref:glutaminase n=1 Tax=Owenia fusiformis TaxID=6347 RepID=A0A8J1TWQ7_OWEFU|nr:unnamed protein product [Owenia fusiformis]